MPDRKHRVSFFLFKDIIKKGRVFSGNCVNIKYKQNTNSYKFTVVVSKKIYKKAHERNKLKRRVREITKGHLKKHSIDNIYIIVFVKQNCKDIKFQELKRLLYKDFDIFLTERLSIS